MQDKLKSADVKEAAPLKKERNVVINKIDTLEEKKIEIQEKIIRKTGDAKKYITEGMTMSNVKSLLGAPDGQERKYDPKFRVYTWRWHYGNSIVHFNGADLVYDVY